MSNTLHTSRREFSARATLAAALVALACGGCALDQPLAGLGNIFGAPAEAKTAAGRSIEGDIDAVKALEFLYGSKVRVLSAKEANSFGGATCSEWALQATVGGEKLELCKIVGEKYTDGDAEKYLLVTASRYSDGGVLASVVATTFVKKDGQWEQEPGSSGLYPSDEINELLIDSVVPLLAKGGKPGVLVTYTDSPLGNCGRFWANAIVPYGDGTKVFPLFSPDSDDDDFTFDMCHCGPSYSAIFDKASQGGYHDIIVKYDDKCENRRRGTQRWTFQNGKYMKALKKGAKKRK